MVGADTCHCNKINNKSISSNYHIAEKFCGNSSAKKIVKFAFNLPQYQLYLFINYGYKYDSFIGV
jgi:hypothetical protein